MKRLLSLVLALIMCFGFAATLVACSPSEPTQKKLASFSVEDGLTCFVGDSFNADSVKLTIYYTDGSTETKTVKEAGASASAVDTATAGKKLCR